MSSNPIILFVGAYPNMADAKDDLKAVDGLYRFKTIGAYQAAIVARDANGELQVEQADRSYGRHIVNNLTQSAIKEMGQLLSPGKILLVVVTESEAHHALRSAMVKATRSIDTEAPSDSKGFQTELDAAVRGLA